MKAVLSEDLRERYTGDTLQLLTKACFLDPRFKFLTEASRDKNLKFLTEASREDAISSLKLKVDLIYLTELSRTSLELVPPPKKLNKLMELIGEMAGSSEEEIPCISFEDQRDMSIDIRKKSYTSPLSWWNRDIHYFLV